MNINSFLSDIGVTPDPSETSPVLVVPYMWIGDFVRGHTVVRVLKERCPNRPVDLLVTSLCAPLVDYMPGVRKGIVWDLPRGQLELRVNTELPDPTVRIVTCCEFGKISTLAAATLRDLGFGRAVALDGGMQAWREAGYETES